MTRPIDPAFLRRLMALWEAAAAEEIGVAVYTNKPQTLIGLLYRARQEWNKPGLDHLSITLSAKDPNIVFIYRKELRFKPPEANFDAESF